MIGGQRPSGDLQIDRWHLFKSLDLLQGEVASAIHFHHVWRGFTGDWTHQEDDVNAVPAIRIVTAANPQDPHHFGLHASFLSNFAHDGQFDRLIRFDETPGDLPVAAAPATGAPGGTRCRRMAGRGGSPIFWQG